MLTKTTTKKEFKQKEVLSFSTYKQLVSSPYELKTLLERKSRSMVSEIVVIHCDRLCRNFTYFPHATKLMVFVDEATSGEHKLSQISLQSSKEEESPDENPKQGKKRKI